MPGLHGQKILTLGRLHGLTRRRLDRLVDQAGGRLASRLGAGVTLVVVAQGLARPLFSGHPALGTLERVPDSAEIVSEEGLRLRLGLPGRRDAEPKTLGPEEVARLSGADDEILFWLALFDVVEPEGGRYGYRDVVAAREVSRLLRAGSDLADIIDAAVLLRRRGQRLSEARLSAAPWGGIIREIEGRPAGLDGQLHLPLADRPESIDDVLSRAEEAEGEGDLVDAERLYRRALAMGRTDPAPAFNLGNVLAAQGRGSEAAFAWRLALERDAAFAEAWFNLAMAAEEAGRAEEAKSLYRSALAASPDYADAAYNLALLLHTEDRFAEALPVWERFLSLEPKAADAPLARRRAAECRLRLQAARTAPTA